MGMSNMNVRSLRGWDKILMLDSKVYVQKKITAILIITEIYGIGY